MDCKSLMIGDLVLLKSNGVVQDTNVQVDEIGKDCLFVVDCDNLICYDEINPIPITKEILETNGIKYQFGQPWYQAYNPLTLEGVFEIVYDDMIRLPIRYVHELQHALRLCGLTELADNFKLK